MAVVNTTSRYNTIFMVWIYVSNSFGPSAIILSTFSKVSALISVGNWDPTDIDMSD